MINLIKYVLIFLLIEKIKSFIVPPGIGVNYKAGTWHFPLISTEDMNFLVVDRKGSGENLVIEDLNKYELILDYKPAV